MTQLLDDELASLDEVDSAILKKYQYRHKVYMVVYVLINVLFGAWTSERRSNFLIELIEQIGLFNDWLLGYFTVSYLFAFVYHKLTFSSVWLSLIVSVISFSVVLLLLTVIVNVFDLSPDSLPFLALLGTVFIITISLYVPKKWQTAYVKATR